MVLDTVHPTLDRGGQRSDARHGPGGDMYVCTYMDAVDAIYERVFARREV